MFHTLKLKAVVKPELFITRSQLRVSKILFGIAVVSLFSTSIFRSAIYSLLPKAYYFLPRRSCIDTITPFWRLPLPLLSREDDTGSGNGEISDPEQSKVRKEELKCATQLTLLLVSTSFSGFAAAFCLLSTTRQIASAQHFRTSKSRCASWLMLGGSVTGMFALLLCRLLSSNDKKLGTTWQRPEGSTRCSKHRHGCRALCRLPSCSLKLSCTASSYVVGAMFPVIAPALPRGC